MDRRVPQLTSDTDSILQDLLGRGRRHQLSADRFAAQVCSRGSAFRVRKLKVAGMQQWKTAAMAASEFLEAPPPPAAPVMSRCSYCGAPVSAEAHAQEYLSWLLHALVFFEDLQIFSVKLLKDMDYMSPLKMQQCLMILMDAIVFYG